MGSLQERLDVQAGKIKLEGAHRVSGLSGRGAEHCKPYPCIMIVRFHYYGDRAQVLEAARQAKNVHLRVTGTSSSRISPAALRENIRLLTRPGKNNRDTDLWLKLSCNSEDCCEQHYQIF